MVGTLVLAASCSFKLQEGLWVDCPEEEEESEKGMQKGKEIREEKNKLHRKKFWRVVLTYQIWDINWCFALSFQIAN